MHIFSPKMPRALLYQNHDLTASARRQKSVPIDSPCYVPCMLNCTEINFFIKCVSKFHFQLLEFDFRFPPFLIYHAIFFPFRKPQVVLKIGKNTSDSCLSEGARRYTNQRISVTIDMLLEDNRLLLAF
jgi:hypothetical protein